MTLHQSIDSNGKVRVEMLASSYHRLLERARIAEAELASEVRHTDQLLKWGQDAWQSERRMADRAVFLYGEAVRRGATHDDLVQPAQGTPLGTAHLELIEPVE